MTEFEQLQAEVAELQEVVEALINGLIDAEILEPVENEDGVVH